MGLRGRRLKSFEQNPTHTYGTKGTYTAKVTVSDAQRRDGDQDDHDHGHRPGRQRRAVRRADRRVRRGSWRRRSRADGRDPDGDDGHVRVGLRRRQPRRAPAPRSNHTYAPAGHLQRQGDRRPTATAARRRSRSRSRSPRPPTRRRRCRSPPIRCPGTSPLAVQFSAQATDPEHGDLGYVWTFGDGGFSAEKNPRHTYTTPGTYTATLKVTDEKGASTTATVQVVVTAAPGAVLRLRARAADARRRPRPRRRGSASPSRPRPRSPRSAKRGLAVKVTATQAMRGSAKITVSKKRRQEAGSEEDHARRRHGEVHRRGQQVGEAEAVRGDQARAEEGQGVREGHAQREPARDGQVGEEVDARASRLAAARQQFP